MIAVAALQDWHMGGPGARMWDAEGGEADGGDELVFAVHGPFAERADMVTKRNRRYYVNKILAKEAQSVGRVAAAHVFKHLDDC